MPVFRYANLRSGANYEISDSICKDTSVIVTMDWASVEQDIQRDMSSLIHNELHMYMN